MKTFGSQLTLFNPITFENNNNWGCQIYCSGDRVYGVHNLALATVIEANSKGIKVLLDNGKTEIVDYQDISKIKTSGFGFKAGDRVRLSPESREFFNLSEDFLGTVKEIFGNSISVNWDEYNDEIISTTQPDWIEKIEKK